MLRLGTLEMNLSSSVQVDQHALCHTRASALWWLLKRIWWRGFSRASKGPFFFFSTKKDLLVTMAITKINVTDSSWIAGRLSPSPGKYSVPELRAHFRSVHRRARALWLCVCMSLCCTQIHTVLVWLKGIAGRSKKLRLMTFNINIRN